MKTVKKDLSNLARVLFSIEKRSGLFYLLAFVPLPLISYFYAEFILGLMIPLYGFILLLLKKPKLFLRLEPPIVQKLFGLLLIFVSFFVYFLVSPFVPNVVFYGFGNYLVYTIGLFLVFFETRTLIEAFSPLFLVVAFVSSSFVSSLAGSLFSPYIPHFIWFITTLLRAIGIAAQQSLFNPNTIVLYTSDGPIQLLFVWACVGFVSMYIFSIILVVLLYEEPSNMKTKIVWSIIGVLGTFFFNIIRIVTLFAGFYFFGHKYGETIHSYIGYILFITWSLIFLCLFSRRATVLPKIRMLRKSSGEALLLAHENIEQEHVRELVSENHTSTIKNTRSLLRSETSR